MKTVSVIIPVYNREKFILKAVDSALNQSLSPLEVLVVDDGSNDNTSVIVKSHPDPRVKYIASYGNCGAQHARLKGIFASTGDIVAFLDSDDELLPDSLQKRMQALSDSGWTEALVYGDTLRNEKVDTFKYLKGYAYKYLLKELSLCPFSTMLIPKNCFVVAGLPDGDFPSWQDDDMVLTIGRHFPVIHCGSPVARMNVMANRISGNKRAVMEGCRRMVTKYKKEILETHGCFYLLCWRARILRSRLIAQWDEVYNRLQKKITGYDILQLLFLTAARLILRIMLMPFFRHFYG